MWKLMFEKLRDDFPMLHGKDPVIYMDSSATSLKPIQVIEAEMRYYKEFTENVHRGLSGLAQRATAAFEEARERVAEFIGAKFEELVFTSGATASINLVAQGIKWKEGDEIVITDMEHHSNYLPWLKVAREQRVKLKVVPSSDDGRLSLDVFPANLSNRTRLVAITHASNVLGTVNRVKEIIKLAKEVGALTLVDGAQSVPHIRTNVKDLGCDFLAFSGHKMLGPTGIGGLYMREGVEDELNPPWLGGGIVKHVSLEEYSLEELPYRFEPGTPNIAGAIGLGEAVAYLEKIGMENVEEYERRLVRRALKGLRGIEGLRLLGPWEERERLGIFSFTLNGFTVDEVALLLEEMSRIIVRAGYHCAQPIHEKHGFKGTVRASLYIYNTEEEVDMLISTLEKIAKLKK